jgi:predicted Zn-dependent peptidase
LSRSCPDFPEPQRLRLRNGIRIVLIDLPWTHWVAIQATVRAGAMYEDDENVGISHFLEHLRCRRCLKPNGNPMAVDDALDALGVYLDAYTSPDHTSYLLQVGPESQAACLEILRGMLFAPDISNEQVDIERQIVQSEYVSGSDDPEEVENIAREEILGRDGLGRPAIGTPESIRGLSGEDLRRFDEQVYVPDNVVLVLAGRLDSEALKTCWEAWESVKRKWRTRIQSPGESHREESRPIPGPKIVFQQLRRSSCDLVFAYPAFGEGDPASVAASLLRHALHKRIGDRLRRSGNPLYDLWLHMHSYQRKGIFFVGARVTGFLTPTVETIHQELLRARDEVPSEEETARMRQWNRTYLIQMLDRPEEYAGRLAIEELYATTLDPATEWKITQEIQDRDLQQVAHRLFHPASLTFCLLGSPGFREKRSIRRMLRQAARDRNSRKEEAQ